MQIEKRILQNRNVGCALWVALCFGLTSAVYLSWLSRLIALAGASAADWFSMVAGYLLQAAGMGIVVLLLRRKPDTAFRQNFTITLLLFAAVSVPALLADTVPGVIGFGWVMNLLCGGIAGFYLYGIGRHVDAAHRSLVFGGGYALATIGVGLLALIGAGGFLHSVYALLLYLPLAGGLALIRPAWNGEEEAEALPDPEERTEKPDRDGLVLTCVVVILISAVKNMGGGFPSVDIEAGMIPELSRLPYAAGLLAAGWIHDRSRKNGMLCTVAALIVPFLLLGLSREPVPATFFWGLDYLFFGFFSVFRVVLFLDVAERTKHQELAPLGLLLGRLGDAAGTGVSLLLADHRVALIVVTALAFFPTVFLLFRLYRILYEPKYAQQHTEQEVFEAFCLHNDLSSRERDVLRMVIDNRSNGEIAEALFISESTVKYHVRNVLQKTGCRNRKELHRKYMLALYPRLGEAERKIMVVKHTSA